MKDGKYELDNVYHNLSEEDLEELDEDERAEQTLTLKISLCDDLEITIKDIFED